MENCCNFIYKFQKIRWTKTALTLCLLPFVFILMIFVIILLCTVQSLGAVVSNSNMCARVGKEILDKGGSAVDAAIATMLCEGIALPSNAGIGGGFSAIMHIDGRFDSITATPTLPLAFSNMETIPEDYADGVKSAGVPGELRGFWEMHQKYGMLSWKEILAPSIHICKKGIPITEWFSGVLRANADKIFETKTLKHKFPQIHESNTKQNLKIRFITLAATLQKIADHGISAFYEGEIGKALIEDVKAAGGVLTLEDLRMYKVTWNKELPNIRLLQRYKVFTTPLPTGGVIAILILNIIKALPLDMKPEEFWYFVVEAMKYAFEMSLNLGDVENNSKYRKSIKEIYANMTNLDVAKRIREKIKNSKTPYNTSHWNLNMESHLAKGYANICVLAQNGDIVVGTSSLMQQFGSYFSSNKTGIILNNIAMQFSKEKNAPNQPFPNKRLLTAFVPTVVVDNLSRPYLLICASGGPRAITLTIHAIIRYVMFEQNSADAVNTEDFYPIFESNVIEYGENADKNIISYFKNLGFNPVQRYYTYNNFTAVTCIGHRGRKPTPEYNAQVGGSSELVTPKQELGFIVVAIVAALCLSVFGLMLYEVLHPRKPTSFNLS